MKTILVTGCAGYIGGTFTYKALADGFRVIGLDNFSNSDKSKIERLALEFPSSFIFRQIDLYKDSNKIRKLFTDYSIDLVVHFAALKSVPESEKYKKKYYENNVLGTQNLVSSLQNKQTSGIIFSSSAAIYGNQSRFPISEKSKPNPISHYAKTKLECEEIIKDATKSLTIKAISLRYFNPLGAHKKKIFFENIHEDQRSVLANILRNYLNYESEFNIFGNSLPTKDGTGIRDYIHIDDLVDGHFKAISHLDMIKEYEVFNLGTNKGVSVNELVQTFNDLVETPIKPKYKKNRPFDIPISYADASKSNKILDWYPRKSLKDMCKSCLEIYK